jgi:hypothetical protein
LPEQTGSVVAFKPPVLPHRGLYYLRFEVELDFVGATSGGTTESANLKSQILFSEFIKLKLNIIFSTNLIEGEVECQAIACWRELACIE